MLNADSGAKRKRPASSLSARPQGRGVESQASIFDSEDHASCSLGVVGYLKRDHQIALIEIDAPDQFGGTEYKKIGLLFYAARSLKDCVGMAISNKGVVLSYFDGSSEPLMSSCIEVDGQWLDGLFEEKQVKPLLDQDGRSRIRATCTTDFRLFKLSDYGVAPLDGTNSLALLEGSQDKKRFEALYHAGFMVTKRMPASTSALAQLIRHLSTNTLQHTDMVCSALVSDNSLQPKNKSANIPYCYIGNGWRYRLMPLNNGLCAGYCYHHGAIDRRAAQKVDGLNPPLPVAVVVEDGLEKTKETADVAIQSDLVLSREESCSDDEYSWDDSYNFPSFCAEEGDDEYYWDGSYNSSSFCAEDGDDDHTLNMQSNTSNISDGSTDSDSNSDEDSGYGEEYTDEQKKGHSSLEDSGIYDVR
ncbi:MAG: hypothetical protein NMK33_01865 [Candidatus Cardinium sp.]|uniref:hypothetical protein n=1 Tax=Cardinium endosymbiont of Dermatophagoides farinae TaxID=2597823 RepID=UPI00118360C8|nr:hypothetical protein [Cardinium endosymbiont of Dermatophagoides farinae]TSJ81236.1 hypothetical protein FPG78_04550 [Cardinium endosymbiont of Dermatophagoides farinae]UWW97289.1 MAG: hypothetical protein NMK33_01865 [Candidatus Cardinium sp.]